MKKYIACYLFFCCTILGYSQENVTSPYDEKVRSLMQIDALNDSTIKLDQHPARTKEGINPYSFQNSYTTTDFMYRNPWGFTNEYVGVFDSDFYYVISGSSSVWPGITTINNAALNFYYSDASFTLNVGADLWKYSNLNRPFNDVAFHADAAYQLLPWLTLGAYGQVSLLAKNNVRDGSALSTPMVPFTGFGAYSRVMFNSTFGVEGNVGRQYNPIKGKWEPTYGFGPVIEFKKKKRK